ncbi:type I restriction enzyme R subunit [Spinactinospora alkalitolerans]|uniref:Type I restriction enzyme R subunit n=1 Tax=Spinactinospora alkalitolerans TaxID=687207 RepID=A0A852TXM4_9ACTN|nr:type I restriction endonuclease [Spinactinospora alkalitolerans]NYE47573.1 type I restriction enzyme R subunit [Spinactinospora alkalitolerans]
MSPIHDERSFEDAIVAAMTADGWRPGTPSHYDPVLGLDSAELFAFIGATQADAWERLVPFHGGSQETAQQKFLALLGKEIDKRGTLAVLREGVKDHGVRFRLAYFKPSLASSADAFTEYEQNRLTVVRQLPYTKDGSDRGNSVDLALFVNGLPVATAELKNPLTGQTVEDAKRQYRRDRNPTEPLFAKRALVHFAIDPDLVFLTTQLKGDDTRFLPFNTGSEGPGSPGGAGNPPPAPDSSGYRTAYLWERIWHPDNWMDLIERFIHLEERKAEDGRSKRKTLIFPRFHQWHAVRTMVGHAARHGAGHNYLVMHSAGSGKSNTIAWLAHRLSSLHAPADPADIDPAALADGLKPNTAVFDKTIIITDRTVLDRQLQDTVGGFQQTEGLVVKVDGSRGSKSAQLAKALSSQAGKIVIVTLQTFPALLDYLKREPVEIRGSRFAIVVDEAHSSQSGDAAADVKRVLRDLGLDADDDTDDSGDNDSSGDHGGAAETDPTTKALTESAKARGRSRNLSYFAFTATPKHKTLELFGEHDPVSGEYRPFHTYSMRQAIEEGFILDPLRNYITYKTYYKLVRENPNDPDDPEVDPDKAGALLARAAYLHPSTLSQHAEIIIEHFRAHTAGRLGGRAKAMVVTRSRESAVKLYRALRKHIDDSGYPDPGVLIAFSGSLKLDGESEELTESQLNGFSEGELPKRFAYTRADDRLASARTGSGAKREYRILVVAEKYQTGFDQPLLTTMYVEKRLKSVAAVQTLSRLNRTHPRKAQDDLFVLDFANEADDVQEAFRPFYEEAVTTATDPNLLYDAQRAVMEPPILLASEMAEFATAYLAVRRETEEGSRQREERHGELYRLTDPALKRFTELRDGEDEADRAAAERFRADLGDYIRKYGFLAQVVPYTDAELERLYLFGKHLAPRLRDKTDGGIDIGNPDLSHLRVVKTGEHDVGLVSEGEQVLPGFADKAGAGADEPEKMLLSEVIEAFNEHFGQGLSEADRLMVEERLAAVMDDPEVQQAAVANNDEEAFRHVFEPAMENAMLERAETNSKFTDRYFTEDEFRSSLDNSMRRAAFRLLRKHNGVQE